MSDTFFAIVACFSIIAAAMMFALAYRMNEQWAIHCEKINREWYELYKKIVDMKVEVAENERD